MVARTRKTWAELGPATLVTEDGTELPTRNYLRVVGATLTDDPIVEETVFEILGGGGAGVCTLEQFGATDDTSTHAAAWTALAAALAADSSRSLMLGAKTYVLGASVPIPAGCSVAGLGGASIIKLTANVAAFTVVNPSWTVTGATNASPIVITTNVANKVQTGDTVNVLGVLGNTAANGFRRVTRLTSTTFSLEGTTGSGAYVSGGVASLVTTRNSFRDFVIWGNDGTSAQIGIRAGNPAVANSCPQDLLVSNIIAMNVGWGFTAHKNVISYRGGSYVGCIADSCTVGGFWCDEAEYITFTGCQSINHGDGGGSPEGIRVQAGNIGWTGGTINNCGIGVALYDSSNAIHGIFDGAQINHNGIAVRVFGGAGATAGHKFVGCHVYFGSIWLEKVSGIQFLGCTLDISDWIFQGSLGTVISDCSFGTISPSILDSWLGETSSTFWRDNTLISTGLVPSWLETRQLIEQQALTANFTTTLATAVSTNLSLPVRSGERWQIEFEGSVQCSSTGGVKFAIAAPAASTVEGWLDSSLAAITTLSKQRITAINTLTATATHTVATTPGPDRIRATVTAGADGSITIQAASNTASQTTTIFAGATLKATRLSGV